jgi:hypothetical protein
MYNFKFESKYAINEDACSRDITLYCDNKYLAGSMYFCPDVKDLISEEEQKKEIVDSLLNGKKVVKALVGDKLLLSERIAQKANTELAHELEKLLKVCG